MKSHVPRTRRWSTSSGIDHRLVREKFRHLAPSGSRTVEDRVFSGGHVARLSRIQLDGKYNFVEEMKNASWPAKIGSAPLHCRGKIFGYWPSVSRAASGCARHISHACWCGRV